VLRDIEQKGIYRQGGERCVEETLSRRAYKGREDSAVLKRH